MRFLFILFAMPASHHLFLVEDERRLAALICEYLAQQGFRISHEVRGDRAAQRIPRETPDLVILDLMLPGTAIDPGRPGWPHPRHR